MPIIVLGARDQESEITQALDNGADDYLSKPFSTAILASRIRALLRRVAKVPGSAQEFFQVGELKIELTKRRVFVDAQEVSLTPIEFNLLSVLVRHAGICGHSPNNPSKRSGELPISNIATYSRIYMGQLRHKLEADPARPRYLLTEAGIGYRLYEGEN